MMPSNIIPEYIGFSNTQLFLFNYLFYIATQNPPSFCKNQNYSKINKGTQGKNTMKKRRTGVRES